MKLLNPGYESETTGGSLYYNSGSGNCYAEDHNATKSCDFTRTGIKNDTTRGLIAEETWSLLGWNTNKVYANEIYEYERSTGKVYTGMPTEWTGKIALPYPSDYGYAADFSKCSKALYTYDDSICTSNNWIGEILETSSWGWLLTPCFDSFDLAWVVGPSGGVGYDYYPYYTRGVAPALSLSSELSIKDGSGHSQNPYQLSV